jgi:hypothetical protein
VSDSTDEMAGRRADVSRVLALVVRQPSRDFGNVRVCVAAKTARIIAVQAEEKTG